jgi:hypothetical protein
MRSSSEYTSETRLLQSSVPLLAPERVIWQVEFAVGALGKMVFPLAGAGP